MSTSHDFAKQKRLEEAGEWCLRVAEGRLGPADQQLFDKWLDADPLNLRAFENSVRVWRQYGEAAAAPEFIDVRKRALAIYRRHNRARWSTRDRSPLLAAIAASLLIFLAVGAIWLHSLPTKYVTGVGERRIVRLEDGSRISLDAQTEVRVWLRKDRRELSLVAGRAKFDVAKDPLRPFSVALGNKVVVATGTSFSVELVRHQMRVVLYEGQVAVLQRADDLPKAAPVQLSARRGPADVQLRPGKELIASLDADVAAVVATDVRRSLSWEAGQLSFVDEPLVEAVERVNRNSDRKIVIGDPEVSRMPVNGVFNSGDVDAFMVGIRETLPVAVHPEGERFVVTKAQDPS